jgi:polyphosphate kinase 2 (PPK2 family)
LRGENLPKPGKHVWDQRLRSIRDFERHLDANGTRIVKFFLHLSKAEQRKRFIARIDEPDKNWKFQASDVEERKLWKDYMRAYQDALGETSTRHAPWYVIPADDKQNARLIVSQIVVDTLEGLKMRYPPTGPGRMRELQAIRRRLADEAN